MKRLYISGPMTGLSDMNFPAFHAEARRLRALGYEVVNPAELNPDMAILRHECLRRDLAALLACDAIVLLDGWVDSPGSLLEVRVGVEVGIPIVHASEVQQCPPTN
jgi:hypothetical protein